MKRQYSLPRLSRRERERLNEILLEEIDLQQWFAITFLTGLDREVVLTMQ